MHYKEWELFVWEEELKVLGIEYFYIGQNFKTYFINFSSVFSFLFLAFIFLGIGGVVSIIAFICEKLCVHLSCENLQNKTITNKSKGRLQKKSVISHRSIDPSNINID